MTRDHDEYLLGVLSEQFCYFALSSAKSEEIIVFSDHKQEVCKGDREFIGRIMKLDRRDRPTATELLADEW